MKTRKDKVDRVEAAITRAGLRHDINAIDAGQNGEVVLWYGGAGHPVYGVRAALAAARDWRSANEALYSDPQE